MKIDQELKQLGLNAYESKAYLSIVNHILIDAKTICKEQDIPYGKIYETLNSLQIKGFIEVQNTRPKKYKAINPTLALENFFAEKQNSMRDELEKTKELLNIIGEKLSYRSSKRPEESNFWKIAFKEEIPKMIIENFNNAQSEINLLVNEVKNVHEFKNISNDIQILLDRIKYISKRGIKIKMLKSQKTDPVYNLINKLEINKEILNSIREIDRDFSEMFMIFDNETVLMRITNPLKKNEILAMIKIWNPTLARDLNDKFLKLWNKGKQFKKLKNKK